MSFTLLMYFALGTWFFSLVASLYGTYRLFEYSPYSESPAWRYFNNIDAMSIVLLGIASSLFATEVTHWTNNWLVVTAVFAGGVISAIAILIILKYVLAAPYVKREEERNRYLNLMLVAKESLTAEGRYPRHPGLFDHHRDEWGQFEQSIEKLREDGELPPVPKWMKDK